MAWGLQISNPSGVTRLTGNTLTLRTVHWEILSGGTSGRRSVPDFSEFSGLISFSRVDGATYEKMSVSWDESSKDLVWDLTDSTSDVSVSLLMYE